MRRRNMRSFVAILIVIAAMSVVAGISTTRESAPAPAPAADTVLLPLADPKPATGSGTDGPGRVINGTKVAGIDASSKWRATSLLLSWDGRSVSQCSASFVARRWLVTAAHCVTDNAGAAFPASTKFYVTNGIHDVKPIFDELRRGKKPADLPTLLVPVRQVVVHPQWNVTSAAFDVAVLGVDRDSTFEPVLLAGPTEQGAWGGGCGRNDASGGAFVAGWGDTDANRFITTLSENLLETAIPIWSDAACTKEWDDQFNPASMICASRLDTDPSYEGNTGSSACSGDSGGPLVATVPDGTLRLVGIVSFGNPSCTSEWYPGVYARVDALRGWIESITGPASGTTSFPAQTVVGGGGGDPAAGRLSVIAPADNATIGATGATLVRWELRDGAQALRIGIRTGQTTYWTRDLEPGATEFLLGHANVRPGTSWICVELTNEISDCAYVRKGAVKPAANVAASIQSATLRNGTLTLRGRVAAKPSKVRVRVAVVVDGKRVALKDTMVRTRSAHRMTPFATSIRWKGRAPRRMQVYTSVKVGSLWHVFESNLR